MSAVWQRARLFHSPRFSSLCQNPIDRGGNIAQCRRRCRLETAFVAVAILSGAHQQRMGKTDPQGPSDVRFRIVADHHGLSFRAVDGGECRAEECRSRLPKDNGVSLACEFQCSDERSRVKAEFSVGIPERPIGCESEQFCSLDQLSKCRIQRFVVECVSRVANNDRLPATAFQALEFLN